MADPLFELEQVVLFKREKLTAEEAILLRSWQYKGLGDFTITALAGGAATWAATWKLRKPLRAQISAGAGFVLGQWMLRRSVYSSVDQILSMDGSILQKELANLLVTKYQNSPDLTMKRLISKHFYSERIFDDSNPNTAKLRWRYRNFFSDNAVHGQRAHDNDNDSDSNAKTQDNSPNVSRNDSPGYSKNVNDSESPNLEARRIFTKAVPDTMTELDPVDSLFDDGPPQEEITHPNPNSPNKPSATHDRSHRRSRRRRRMRNHEDLLNG
ncbi:hypothetical protein PIB30_024921 [Stylosanthes scabra]|uniref:Uncharacterized protein n=1 Tax=Stylosanthes scabra TaxID=79078 RepID=A0ABU6T9N7_9FABA|nr:hypothetical protein [Stylosanthes scabra]